MGFEVELRNVDGSTTAAGTVRDAMVVDPLVDRGGGGHGFNGAQLLHLAVAGCTIAEIPNSLRDGTEVQLESASVTGRA